MEIKSEGNINKTKRKNLNCYSKSTKKYYTDPYCRSFVIETAGCEAWMQVQRTSTKVSRALKHSFGVCSCSRVGFYLTSVMTFSSLKKNVSSLGDKAEKKKLIWTAASLISLQKVLRFSFNLAHNGMNSVYLCFNFLRFCYLLSEIITYFQKSREKSNRGCSRLQILNCSRPPYGTFRSSAVCHGRLQCFQFVYFSAKFSPY